MVGIIVNAALGAVVLHTGDLAVGSCYAHTDLIRAAEHTAVRHCADVGARAGGQTGDRDKLHGLFGDIGSLAVLDGDGLDGNGAVCVAVRPDGQRCAFKVPVYTRGAAIGGIPDDTAIPGRNMKFRRGCCCIQQLRPSVCRFQGWRRGRLLTFLVVEVVKSIKNSVLNSLGGIGCTGNSINIIGAGIVGHTGRIDFQCFYATLIQAFKLLPEVLRIIGRSIKFAPDSIITICIGIVIYNRCYCTIGIKDDGYLCGIIEIVYFSRTGFSCHIAL